MSRLDEVWEQGEVVTSLLVVGELIFGVEKSIRREANLAAVEQQLAMLDGILPPTDAIVRRFGRLKAERQPFYAQAPIHVTSGKVPHARTLARVLDELTHWLDTHLPDAALSPSAATPSATEPQP